MVAPVSGRYRTAGAEVAAPVAATGVARQARQAASRVRAVMAATTTRVRAAERVHRPKHRRSLPLAPMAAVAAVATGTIYRVRPRPMVQTVGPARILIYCMAVAVAVVALVTQTPRLVAWEAQLATMAAAAAAALVMV